MMSFDCWYAIKKIEEYERIRNEIFEDDLSKQVLDTLVYEMLTNENRHFEEIYMPNQYFCLPDFIQDHKTLGFNESFVDLGAYTGDSVEAFISKCMGKFDHIYAFEPMEKLYRALNKRVLRLIDEWAIDREKITCVKAGISDTSREFEASVGNYLGSNLRSNETATTEKERVIVTSLDEYFRDKTVTFIKADIEGYEMNLLRGACETIKRNKPKMALCVYHKPTDIFEFIKYISGIVPEYKYRLRHHSYNEIETVLYCNV